jgi:hypothetical protein
MTDEERELFLQRVFIDVGPEPPTVNPPKQSPQTMTMAQAIAAAFRGMIP